MYQGHSCHRDPVCALALRLGVTTYVLQKKTHFVSPMVLATLATKYFSIILNWEGTTRRTSLSRDLFRRVNMTTDAVTMKYNTCQCNHERT